MQRDREQAKKRTAISFLSPRRAEPACILPQHALNTGGKRNGLKRRVADLLISEGDGTKRPFLGHKRHSEREENMDTPLLWHIPLSHYSEKVRWALDYKGIAHRRRVLGPDYLIRASGARRVRASCPFCGSMDEPSRIQRASSPRSRNVTSSCLSIRAKPNCATVHSHWRTTSTKRSGRLCVRLS
jgi:hypothetical protein